MGLLMVLREEGEIKRLKKSMKMCGCDVNVKRDPCVWEMHRGADAGGAGMDKFSLESFVKILIIAVHNAVQPTMEEDNIYAQKQKQVEGN